VPAEPAVKRAVVFVDGQNLFHAARQVFGATYPDYDPLALADAVCRSRSWSPTETRFYTGIPAKEIDPYWHGFWMNKLAMMGRRGVHVCSRELQYHDERVQLPDGTLGVARVGREKGIDVRIALDIVRLALLDAFDVAVIFSQDQDLAEAASDVRDISVSSRRWIRMACAFPWSPSAQKRRGINNTEWIRVSAGDYAAATDPRDYRVS
jgi:uncharacterized LabA/DUF88 family protein